MVNEVARKYNDSSKKLMEEELQALAMDLARKQLKEGTAPASTVNFYLKMASSREETERQLINKQVELLEAKANNIKRSEDEAKAYRDAIDAIKSYAYNKTH